MHEMALCNEVLDILQAEAARQGFVRVRRLWLEIGELAGVERDALGFGFQVVAAGTLAEGAELLFVDCPGEAWCATCERTVRLRSRVDCCPDCGGYRLQVTGGTGLRVKELEVD
jgi:hydrogenase nickel incorporation protein HypA/HybF